MECPLSTLANLKQQSPLDSNLDLIFYGAFSSFPIERANNFFALPNQGPLHTRSQLRIFDAVVAPCVRPAPIFVRVQNKSVVKPVSKS